MSTEPLRAEYKWLAEEARYLTSNFGFTLPEESWLDHDRLMDGCECLDRKVDGSPDEIRPSLTGRILQALRGGSPGDSMFDAELSTQIEYLVDIFERYGPAEYFLSRAEGIFGISEEIRATSDRKHYVELVCREGRYFLEMFLPIFERHATAEFMKFFPSVAEVGNLVDKLVDARADYRRGEMLLYPGVPHHLSLLKEITSRGWEAFRLFPNRTGLFVWAIRFFNPRRHISAK
ncbi:MAG: hypothetical protein WC314_17230 [Vulcanimicrobiota bacterium]